ncbi:hypothetical protein UY3_10860 [Chelonia mydas]|uniref:Uncharacterized protein n=1 Tax=Chelonia mydas TaxID=8469 RepID=M7BIR5_CHEMY|nr:hypothetical protein UY3_10860 [Chelonia mydas]
MALQLLDSRGVTGGSALCAAVPSQWELQQLALVPFCRLGAAEIRGRRGLALKSTLPFRIRVSVDAIRRYWPPGATPQCIIVTALDSTLNSDALARCTGKALGTFESHFLFGQASSSAQGGGTTTTPPLSVDSYDGILSAMPEDFAGGEEEEEEDDELGESTQHTVLPDSQDLFITLTEIPSQLNETREGTSGDKGPWEHAEAGASRHCGEKQATRRLSAPVHCQLTAWQKIRASGGRRRGGCCGLSCCGRVVEGGVGETVGEREHNWGERN